MDCSNGRERVVRMDIGNTDNNSVMKYNLLKHESTYDKKKKKN